MKRLILIIITVFIFVSCQKNVTVTENTLISTPVKKIIKQWSDNILTEEILDTQNELINIDGNTSSWGLINDNSWKLDLVEILSIEDQYCLSKWWKIERSSKNKYCIFESDNKINKCEINMYYNEKCSSNLIFKDEILGIKEKIIKNINKKVVIGNVNENTWIEKKELSFSLNSSIKKQVNDKKNEFNIVKIKMWKSWKYYIQTNNNWDTILTVTRNDWKKRSIFKWVYNNNVEVIDYELMVNKQVKVFYNIWDSTKEQIIDLNEILID